MADNFIDKVRGFKNKVIYVKSNGKTYEFTDSNEAADFMEQNRYYSVDWENIGTSQPTQSTQKKSTTTRKTTSTKQTQTPKQKAYRRKYGDWVANDPRGKNLGNISNGEMLERPDNVLVTEDGKIISLKDYQNGMYDVVEDQTWDQLYGPPQLDPSRIPAPVDFNFLSPRAGAQNYWINRQNGVFYNPAMARAMATNTFKGWSDMYAENHNAAANSPVFQAFKEANDAVGNTAIDLFLLGGAGNTLNAGRELITDMGLKAAARYAVPRIIAGVAGGVTGGHMVDQGVNTITQGAVPSWSYGMQQMGMTPFNASMTNPGVVAGTYAGTTGYDWVANNWPSMWWNFQQGFPRMAPFNYGGEAVMVEPGETAMMEGVSTPQLYGTRGAGTRWSGQGTVQGHRGATPQARGSHQVSSGGAARGTGKTTSVTPRHEAQVMANTARGPIPSTTNVPAHVAPDPATGFYFTFPYFGPTPPPPVMPPVLPPPAEPEPEFRHVVTEQHKLPFELWFAEQVKNGKYGTTQYYSGDEFYEAGPKVIIYGGTYNPRVETREVFTDPEGYQAADSTTSVLTEERRPRSQRKVKGGVPKEARINPNRRINVSESE